MQKVEGSSPFSRSQKSPPNRRVFLCSNGADTLWPGRRYHSALPDPGSRRADQQSPSSANKTPRLLPGYESCFHVSRARWRPAQSVGSSPEEAYPHRHRECCLLSRRHSRLWRRAGPSGGAGRDRHSCSCGPRGQPMQVHQAVGSRKAGERAGVSGRGLAGGTGSWRPFPERPLCSRRPRRPASPARALLAAVGSTWRRFRCARSRTRSRSSSSTSHPCQAHHCPTPGWAPARPRQALGGRAARRR